MGAVPFSPLDEGVCVDATVVTLADISMSGTSVGISMFIGPNNEVIDWIDAVGFSTGWWVMFVWALNADCRVCRYSV
jgi:hypothetical protein